MLVHIEKLLSPEQVRQMRSKLGAADAPWVDGRITAGFQGAPVKFNQQLDELSPLARELGDHVLAQLERHPRFISACLPLAVYPPMFNRYGEGMAFGSHVDGAIRMVPGSGRRLRTDISATLFLSEPDEYEGGELQIDDAFGSHVDGAIRIVPGSGRRLRTDISATLFLSEPDEYEGGELQIDDAFGMHGVKLAAGDMIVYPASSLHRVTPITRGVRVASFFWVQSMIRDDGRRTLLFDMDNAIQTLNRSEADEGARSTLVGNYHNLVRMWGDA